MNISLSGYNVKTLFKQLMFKNIVSRKIDLSFYYFYEK